MLRAAGGVGSRKLTAALPRMRQPAIEPPLSEYRMKRQERQRSDRKQMAELQNWWLKRLIETPRPLEEKMTLFWHGHFATNYRAIEDSYHMFLQNQFFRHHAVGSFRAVAHGIIRDPAMLRYLNNDQNRRQSPNENLARLDRKRLGLLVVHELIHGVLDAHGGERAHLAGRTAEPGPVEQVLGLPVVEEMRFEWS